MALERATDRIERTKPDRARLAGLEDREVRDANANLVGKLVQPPFSLRQYDIEIHDNRGITPDFQVTPEPNSGSLLGWSLLVLLRGRRKRPVVSSVSDLMAEHTG